jgi:hypothetical protein
MKVHKFSFSFPFDGKLDGSQFFILKIMELKSVLNVLHGAKVQKAFKNQNRTAVSWICMFQHD